MIQLKINNMDHKAILTVPADYERVILALWTIGLDRDPEKYTLRQLDAEFTYTTEEESQMVRLIDPRKKNYILYLFILPTPRYLLEFWKMLVFIKTPPREKQHSRSS